MICWMHSRKMLENGFADYAIRRAINQQRRLGKLKKWDTPLRSIRQGGGEKRCIVALATKIHHITNY